MRLGRAPITVLARCVGPRAWQLFAFLALLAISTRVLIIAGAIAVSHANTSLVAKIGAAAAALLLLQRVLEVSARVAIESALHRETARAVLMSDVLSPPAAETQKVFQGLQHATTVVANALPALVGDIVVSIGVVPLVLGSFAPRVVALAATSLAIVMVAMLLVRRPTRRLEERLFQARDEIGNSMLVALEGRVEIVAAGAEGAFTTRLEDLLKGYERLARRSSFTSALLGRAPLAAGIASVIVAIALDNGSRAAVASALVLQALVLAACVPPIMGVVLGTHSIARSSTLLAPLARLLCAPHRPRSSSKALSPRLPTAIVADTVSFAYEEGGPTILDRVSFTWSVGEPLVLAGQNGSGKSTLMRLLLGLRPPTSGSIRIGDTPLAEIDPAELRARAVYLPQRPYLGETYFSVRAAMQIFHPDADDQALIKVLERVAVMDVLRERSASDPLSVPIGELSSGQRQRIALGRVLLRDAPLVLLDEPDANLDAQGVALIVELVNELSKQDRMVALAAHSPTLTSLSSSRVVLGG